MAWFKANDPAILAHEARGMITDQTPKQAPAPGIVSEKQFQSAVIALAKRHLWLCYHTFDSRKSQAGFPDLVLVRDRIIFAELKTETGRPTADQERWLEGLREAGAEVHLWKPSDWASIEATLAREAT